MGSQKRSLQHCQQPCASIDESGDYLDSLHEMRNKALNSHLSDILSELHREKLNSKTIPELYSVSQKEQGFLASVGRATNNLHADYKIEDNSVRLAISNIIDNPKLYDKTKVVIEQAIDQGLIKDAQAASLYQTNYNMSSIFTEASTLLESHHISSNLERFENQILQAETAYDILNAHKQRQEFLINLEGNLEYHKDNDKIQNAIREAKDYFKDDIIDKLQKAVEDIEANNYLPKKELVAILKNSTDLTSTHHSLDKRKEEYYIKSNLDELSKSKQKAKTPQEALKALAKEQEFLSSLHNNLKYNDYSRQLLEDINKAHALKSTNEINNLYNTANYAYKEKILSADDLTNHFKSNHHLDIIHDNINDICFKHNCSILNEHCNKIASGQSIMHHGHEFDCVVNYLEHWKDNVDHKMLPIKQIDDAIERELDRQIEHDHRHHELDL